MADENNEMREELFAPFDPTKKKKKKKVLQDLAESSTGPLMEKADSMPAVNDDGLESTFTGMKKKKKPVASSSLNDENVEPVEDLDGVLLGTVFKILRENNPDLGDRRRTVMRPPQVLREGTKKTVFVNFMDLCRTMRRQPDHVMHFLLDEMGTSGSIDGQQRFRICRISIIVLSNSTNDSWFCALYLSAEYVICLGCKSPDTILSKENRLIFVRCEKCGSGRSVTAIKTGYLARVSRRKT
ncbi:unnamed protein product [Arabis nemorensis]|uniref:Eukaryotic translation initiation factor 2 subunit beta n=1 Tax=Arabis nemorensis TaxID=586526 RepID=A0A565B6C9_9BRAS|nr:unnamed protein product [Arabis nemorensis]